MTKLAASWGVVLTTARSRETWRGLAAVQQRPDLASLVLVWPSAALAHPWQPPKRAPPTSANAAWEILWGPEDWLERVVVAAADALQWDFERTRAAVMAAIQCRILYPDGTCHRQVDLHVQIVSTLATRRLRTQAGIDPTGA